MSDSKFLKAKCRKTGRIFGIELKYYGKDYEVENIADLSPIEYKALPSNIKQKVIRSHSNLRPCSGCGGRLLGGCSCGDDGKCTTDMPFKLDCLYCRELELDYSPAVASPYNACAGRSNIPGVSADKHGNPKGSQFDLARDGAFEGYTVIILNLGAVSRKFNLDDPIRALKRKGFSVIEYRKVPDFTEFKATLFGGKTQLWILSDKEAHLERKYQNLIKEYFLAGNGVYFMGEEEPYFRDANPIIGALFASQMHGNNRGGRVLNVQPTYGMPGIIANHFITTGIVNFYEGTTIATVELGNALEPLIYSSNKEIIAAYYEQNGCRAIVDGGYTRLYCQWDSAGTDRYVVNAAAWLANFERFG